MSLCASNLYGAVKRIAIFASGAGTNAENIIRWFNTEEDRGGRVALVVSNKPDAQVLRRAGALGVATEVVTSAELKDEDFVGGMMDSYGIDVVVLAGFLLMVPPYLITRYDGRMVNIHPSLLPKYGGKGMYGMRVHEAVVAAGERETGITVHLVSERYDEGRILFQATTEICGDDAPEDVARKVQELEQLYFPRVIAELMEGMW